MFEDLKIRIRDFIRRHRAHCAAHGEYTKGCSKCREANGNGIVLYDNPKRHIGERPNTVEFSDTKGADASFDGSGGGDSGGGGASGDL
jgi:uncharacterized membrane protein YgcG